MLNIKERRVASVVLAVSLVVALAVVLPGGLSRAAGGGKVRAAFDANAGLPTGTSGNAATATISTKTGILLINAGSDIGTNNIDDVSCTLSVDGAPVAASTRTIELSDDPGTFNFEEDCTTEGALNVAPGSHTVTFAVNAVGPTTTVGNTVLWAIFVPAGKS